MVKMHDNADKVPKPSARRAMDSPASEHPSPATDPDRQRAAVIVRLAKNMVDKAQTEHEEQTPPKRRRRRSDVGDSSSEPGDRRAKATHERRWRRSGDAGAAGWPERLEVLRERRDAYDEPYEEVNDALRNLRRVVVESGRDIADAAKGVGGTLVELGGGADNESIWVRRLQDGVVIWTVIGVMRVVAPHVLTPGGAFAAGFAYSFMREMSHQAS